MAVSLLLEQKQMNTNAQEMHPRTKELHELMADRSLTCKQVAELLGRSEKTVLIWRTKSDDKVIPDNALQLLKYKLGAV